MVAILKYNPKRWTRSPFLGLASLKYRFLFRMMVIDYSTQQRTEYP